MRKKSLKSKETAIVRDNGISIAPVSENNVSNVSPLRKKLSTAFQILFEYLIINALMLGALLCFGTMISLKYDSTIVSITVLIVSAVAMLIFKLLKKRWIVLISSCGIILIIGGIMYSSISTGILAIYDIYVAAVAKSMKTSIPDSIIKWQSGMSADTTLVMALAFALICIFVAYFISARKSFVGSFLLTFPFFEAGAAFGLIPDRTAFAMLIAGYAAVLALSLANRGKTRIKNSENGKTVSKEKLKNKHTKAGFAVSAGVLALVIFIVFMSVQSALVQMGYDRSENLDVLRHDIRNYYSDVVDYITGVDHDASLKEGRLTEMGDLKYKQRHYLDAELPDNGNDVLLKGYVGSSYTGTAWEDINYTETDKKLIDRLTELDASPAALLGSMLNSGRNKYTFSSNQITISNLRRQKDYAFITYGAYAGGDVSANYDIGLNTANKSGYSYTDYADIDAMYMMTSTKLYTDTTFKSQYAQYKSMVKSKYTQLPDSVLQNISPIVKNFGGSNNAKVDKVREYLSANTEYSDFSKKLPNDTDFVDYFLNTQKYGYSAHYATAAAVMLKAAGVPTRYVEGYIIGAQQIKDSEKAQSGLKKVNVTDENAHAWIEIFDNTYGWVPVEVTPGYYSVSFAQQMQEVEQKSEDEPPQDEQEESESEEGTDYTDIEEVPNPDDSTNIEEIEAIPERTNYGWAIFIAITASIIGVLLILILVLVIARIVSIHSLKNRMENGSVDERSEAIYNYFIRLLKFEGIRQNNRSFENFEKEIHDKSQYAPKENLHRAIVLIEKFGFSKTQLNEEDVFELREYVENYAFGLNEMSKESYRSREFRKRLKLKYINHLK